jgi:hypothetical protein
LAVVGCGILHYDDSLRVPLSSIDQHSGESEKEAARESHWDSELKTAAKTGNSGATARVDCARIKHNVRTGKSISKRREQAFKRNQSR